MVVGIDSPDRYYSKLDLWYTLTKFLQRLRILLNDPSVLS